ncbi:MAG: ABC transporter ATP-binding protein [Anaerolineae bacterium]|nr:ABC transporter ATP-binding protein [Anaerolineae bacterium]
MIEVENLVRKFGAVTAVSGLTLSVPAGEIYGLVGPDGAGKTTTFRLLVGALLPDSGRGAIGGHDLLTEIEAVRWLIGYLPQRFSLYPDLTVAENLRFFAEVNGLPPQEWQPRREEMLAFVGLAEFANRQAWQLSGGMKQKLGLATALIHQPRLLLLDEPTGGVDPVTRQDFWQLIGKAVVEEGLTVLVSTPYMDEASRCNRIGFMQHGRILAEGTPQSLIAPLHGRILELVASPRRLVRQVVVGDTAVEDIQPFGHKFHLRVQPGTAEIVQQRLPVALTAAGATVERLALTPPLLEDAFIELLGRNGTRTATESGNADTAD